MRIDCPSCHAAYEVPDDRLTGKKVRCARCETEWLPPAPAVAEMIDPPPKPPPPPAPKPFLAVPEAGLAPRPRAVSINKRPQRNLLLIAAWCTTLLLVAAIIAVAIQRREAVMTAWPPSQRLYAWIGLH